MPDVAEKLSEAEWDSLPPSTPEPAPTTDEPDYYSMPAPYGRFKNGRPRKTPPNGKKPGTSSKRKTGTDYTEGILGLFQLASFGLSVASGGTNKVFLADSLAIASHADNIATATNMLAQERPEIAAVLDKILAVGPYGALIAAVSPLIIQIVSNHGVKLPGVPNASLYLAQMTTDDRPENTPA